jgi:GH24 family phage-related lysozyme (muramidase)
VRAGWLEFTDRFESCTNFAYWDVRGLVTISYGVLIDPFTPDVLFLPWRYPSGELASADDATRDWRRVKGMPAALVASSYRDAIAGLHLADAYVDALALERLDAMVRALEVALGPLDRFPTQVQQVMCSLAWAEGTGWVHHYPKFLAAIAAGDWATAADESRINETGNPGVRIRNQANRALLLSIAP